MRFLAPLLFVCTFAASSHAQVEAPKAPPIKAPVPGKFKTTAPTTVKANDHIVVDASTAKGKVEFLFDAIAFPKERATLTGKVLVLSTSVNGTYTIGVVSYDDGTTERILVKVTGGVPVPPIPDPPIPTDPLEKLVQSVASLQKSFDAFVISQTKTNAVIEAKLAAMDARLTALEQVKPIPPPSDPFQAAVQAAYEKDGKPASAVSQLAAVYRQSGPTVNNPAFTKSSQVLGTMHQAAQSLIQDQLPSVRRVIADELNMQLGKADKTLDAATRTAIAAQFLRAQKALEGVK